MKPEPVNHPINCPTCGVQISTLTLTPIAKGRSGKLEIHGSVPITAGDEFASHLTRCDATD